MRAQWLAEVEGALRDSRPFEEWHRIKRYPRTETRDWWVQPAHRGFIADYLRNVCS
jgi:hypothetical protein